VGGLWAQRSTLTATRGAAFVQKCDDAVNHAMSCVFSVHGMRYGT
jgi:hypothetical protein